MISIQDGNDWGHGSEEFARRLAADLGVPDFVYNPVLVTKGSATREVSDGMLIVGDRGLIIQSKARDPQANDSPERARAWATKAIAAGAEQVKGTRRTLRQKSALTVTSLRGQTRRLAVEAVWPGVVILNMPIVPSELVEEPIADAIVAMTLDDWQQLNNMLLSTTSIIDYIHRVCEARESVSLGQEAARYFFFARKDQSVDGPLGTLPRLPIDFLSNDDLLFAAVVDERVEDLGHNDPTNEPLDPDVQRGAIEVLDSLPPLHRVVFGRKWIDVAQKAMSSRKRRSSFMRMHPGVGSIIFYADVAENYDDLQTEVSAILLALALVRHEQAASTTPDPGPTLAMAWIGALDGVPGGRALHTLAFIDGDPIDTLDPEVRWSVVEEFGVLDLGHDAIRRTDQIGRNEQCPCRSGRKFKQCHSGRSPSSAR